MNKEVKATKEAKSFLLQVKDFDDAKGIVRGYLSTFNNVDEGGDRVLPGAFKKTLQDKYEFKKQNNTKYLIPLLWQHQDDQPIGGYRDAHEDNIGLFVEFEVDIDIQKGKEAYSGLKKGYIFQQSIGYNTVKSNYVKVDETLVRDLIEIELFEGSLVTFPMNPEAIVTSVKGDTLMIEQKAIVGDTSLSIGPRDEKWDGTRAQKQIFSYAKKDDGSFDEDKLKKCFIVQDGDPQQKGSYSYPFCFIIDGSPRICVGAVKSIAGAIQGSRGVDAPDGLKKKVEALYNRINKQYPDDTPLTPPWKDDSKMSEKTKQKKTLQEHYAEEMCADLIEDWQDVFICALSCAVLDAFKIGDQPEVDISEALDQFKELVLTKFVPEAIECQLSQYLSDNAYTSADYTIHNGSYDPYSGYMSRRKRMMQKSGEPISAANQQVVDNHVKNLKTAAKTAKAAMQSHASAIHDTAEDIESLTDDQKSGRTISNATASSLKEYASAIHAHAEKAADIMNQHVKVIRTAADDFATAIQGSEPLYDGDDPGKPDAGREEGKSDSPASSGKTRKEQEGSSLEDTLIVEELAKALLELKSLVKV